MALVFAELEATHQRDPGLREAQRVLAREATGLLHGPTEMQQAEDAGKALFSGEIASLPHHLFNEVFSSVPTSNHDKVDIAGEGRGMVDLLVDTKIAASKSQARELLNAGSVSVNGRKVGVDDRLKVEHLLHGSVAAIRKGKKNWHLTRWA